MAKLSRSSVLHLARLARLNLSEEEIERFRAEISDILSYVEKLQDIDTDNLKPTHQVTGLKDVMRADKIKDYGTASDDLLKNAPAAEEGYIKVKKVLG